MALLLKQIFLSEIYQSEIILIASGSQKLLGYIRLEMGHN